MARKEMKKPEPSSGLPLWLGTFGDLMSLLLTFFILLLSMATFDTSKLAEAEGSVRGALSILEGGIKTEKGEGRITLPGDIVSDPEYAEDVNVLKDATIDFNQMSNISKGLEDIINEEGLSGFIIALPTKMLFNEERKLKDESRMYLKRIALIANEMPENIQVEVLAKSNYSFDSRANLDRASANALEVARTLYAQSVDGARIDSVGMEDKTLPRINGDTIEIKFYAKERKRAKGMLD